MGEWMVEMIRKDDRQIGRIDGRDGSRSLSDEVGAGGFWAIGLATD